MPADSTAIYRRRAAWIALYVGAALLTDFLATHHVSFPFAWDALRWRGASGFDYVKFATWLAIPFVFSLRGMDWGFFGAGRWRRGDGWFLAGLIVVGAAAVFAVLFIPSLREVYPGMAEASASAKRAYAAWYLVWTLSWLPGWEFLHRYVALRALDRGFPRWGWLLIPAFEGAYHLDRPAMAAGMVVFSLAATYWARRRRNLLLPFLAHLVIELEFLALLLFA